jgi:hypothetical protein
MAGAAARTAAAHATRANLAMAAGSTILKHSTRHRMTAAPPPLDSFTLSPQRKTPAHASPDSTLRNSGGSNRIPLLPSTIPAYLILAMEKGHDLVVNTGNSFSCKV